MKPIKLVCGAGVNDADYDVQKFETIDCADGKQKKNLVWRCPYYRVWKSTLKHTFPYYRVWKSMLERCYSAKAQDHRPTYAGCTVSAEWRTFSNFKSWMETQDWQGKQLDKDLITEGNKVYSDKTCVFVSLMVNTFTTDSGATRGAWMIGVDWYKASEKFRARCSNPFSKKNESLGYFTCEVEAHQAWQKRKLELAHELAAIQEDPRVAKALVDRYSKIQTSEMRND